MTVNNVVPFTFNAKDSAQLKHLHKPSVLQDFSFNVHNAVYGRVNTPQARTQIERVKQLAERIFLNCVNPNDSDGLLDEWRDAFEGLYVVRHGLDDEGSNEFNAFLKHAINLNSVVWFA